MIRGRGSGSGPLFLCASAQLPDGQVGHRIDQVGRNFVEVLVNAAKFGEGKPIAIAVDADETRARIRVTDRGIGIASDAQARVFERFERAVPSEHFGGLGIGLYIVRQVVDAHGGEVRVESTPGAGASFTVELPRSPPEAAGVDGATARPASGA